MDWVAQAVWRLPKVGGPSTDVQGDPQQIAKAFNSATIDRCRRNSDQETNAELVQITLSELEREWITEEVEISSLEEDAVLSPMFLIHQGEKSRASDDLTFSHINSTIGSSERILLQGVDELASMAKQLMKSGLRDLVGRTYDLESAYRQLPIHPADRNKAIIVVHDIALGKTRAFQMASMPYGAVASAYAFLRTAAAINHLGCSLSGVPMISYFDDFSILTQRELAKGTKLAVETLFEVLGILLSKAEKKNVDFAKFWVYLLTCMSNRRTTLRSATQHQGCQISVQGSPRSWTKGD